MTAIPKKFNPTLSVVFLIAANAIPLIGVLFWGWSVGAVLLAYWIESVIIGVLNIPRIWAAKGAVGKKLFTSVFFSVHYGAFAFAHLTILTSLFGAQDPVSAVLSGGTMMWTAISFFISHLVSLILRLYRREFKDKTAAEQLFAPYGRVMIMHIVVLFGAFFIEFLGSPIYAIVLLVVLKTAIDLRAHRREGRDSRALESLQVSSN
jgi:hypothetical protein